MGKKRIKPSALPVFEPKGGRYHLPNSEEVYFVKYAKSYLPVLWEWHKEHVKINFPNQTPDFQRFSKDINNGLGLKEIAIYNHKPAGFVWVDTMYNAYEETMEAVVKYVHVDKEYRGKGIGIILMQHIHLSVNHEARYFILGTHVDNTPAIELYKKMGYKPYRLIMRRD